MLGPVKMLGKGKKEKPPLITAENILKSKSKASFKLRDEHDIAMDFSLKIYKKFSKMVKSVVLFGSTVKKSISAGSDIDIIIIIDDASIQWDSQLITWYRTELGKIMRKNPYSRDIHVNTIKLTTWWADLIRGDPVVLNVIRYGESLLDFGGFFEPLKILMAQGKIRSSPEAIYSSLQRAPHHFARSKISELNSIEGLYWAMVDSAHAALIAAEVLPPSPEHVPMNLNEYFVSKKMLDKKHVIAYQGVFELHKKIARGQISDLKGVEIDDWQEKTEEFMKAMAKLVDKILDMKKK
jgi:predicted nucleotidyltransferase/uncharacterized protein (UPF0332 family)